MGSSVLNRPMGFNVTEYTKFIDAVLDFPFELTFKKPLLTEFWCIIKRKIPTIIFIRKQFFHFNLQSHVRPDFLCILQPTAY